MLRSRVKNDVEKDSKTKCRKRSPAQASIIVLILLSAACFRIEPTYFANDKNHAEKKIESFHELYNDQKFDEMYDLLSVQTKRVLTFDNFSQAYGDVRLNFGKVKKSTRIEEGVKLEATFRVVRLVFETEFEKARVREEFVCHVTNEDAVIYFIEKPEVIR